MNQTYTKKSTILSSKNVHFSKKVILGRNQKNEDDLPEKKIAIEKQLELINSQQSQIIEEAHQSKNRIIEDAKRKSVDIEQNAYKEGYAQGLKNGYEDGHKEAYDEVVEKTKEEIESSLLEASTILLSSKEVLANYISDNKEQIIELSVAIAEQVLLEKFEDRNSMNKLIEEAIKSQSKKESLIVKINPVYEESIKNNIDCWKREFSIKDDIHVIGLSSIKKGNAIIETDKGMVGVGIDTVLENIKKELI